MQTLGEVLLALMQCDMLYFVHVIVKFMSVGNNDIHTYVYRWLGTGRCLSVNCFLFPKLAIVCINSDIFRTAVSD